MNKIKDLLESDLSNNLTIIITSTSDLVFDERSYYGCKEKCPNYKKRCFCPPYSNEYTKKVKDKKYVIIFVKTQRYSDLDVYKNKKSDSNDEKLENNVSEQLEYYNEAYLNYQNQIKPLFRWWGLDQDDLFSAGFPIGECDFCFKKKKNRENGVKEECFPMPSSSAFNIDVMRSLSNLRYNIDLNYNMGMARIAMIFTNNQDCESYLDQTFSNNDVPFPILKKTQKNPIDYLPTLFPDVEFKEININDIVSHLKEKYKWLKLWKYAVLWRSKSTNNELKQKIHSAVFKENYYFSQDYYIKKIVKEENVLLKQYDGIEFY
ncbi:MAG: hypothetical protein GY870_14380 [archaeon]|nr:hypothetical protein [archaeon]